MSSSQNQASSGGVGFCGLLALLFIFLKLTHQIDWSWVWVTAPLWGPVALILAIIAVVLVWLLLKLFWTEVYVPLVLDQLVALKNRVFAWSSRKRT